MFLRKILTVIAALSFVFDAQATIDPKATYTKDGQEVSEWSNFTADAPLEVHFTSNATGLAAGEAVEWHITHKTSGTNVTRYDQDIDFVFTNAGLNKVTLLVRTDNDVTDSTSIEITISDSHLEMPNAFSPNDDGINDRYQAKSNSKGIVEFHAYIFNRHGQKLFDWTDWQDPKGGWDGKYNGHPVKDGVYFVYVKARGADGIEYNIRRDVNIIRKHNNTTGTSTP